MRGGVARCEQAEASGRGGEWRRGAGVRDCAARAGRGGAAAAERGGERRSGASRPRRSAPGGERRSGTSRRASKPRRSARGRERRSGASRRGASRPRRSAHGGERRRGATRPDHGFIMLAKIGAVQARPAHELVRLVAAATAKHQRGRRSAHARTSGKNGWSVYLKLIGDGSDNMYLWLSLCCCCSKKLRHLLAGEGEPGREPVGE